MVPWLSGLKLDREMWTHPGRSMPMFWARYPHPQVQGVLKWDPGVPLQRDRTLKGGLEFAAGVENALGKAGYPC